MKVALGRSTVPERTADRRESTQTGRIRLLEAAPELGQGLTDQDLLAARESLVPISYPLPSDEWTPQAISGVERALGLLILDGFVLRRVSAGHGTGLGIELLGPHDLLRPWQQDSASFADSAFDVIETSHVAVLDEPMTALMCQWPPLVANVVALALTRSRSLALQAAIMNTTGIEVRVHALLWALAEKWGTVSSDGVTFKLQLPQRVLAQIIGCRRPTVSTAIQSLREKGLIDATQDGRWVLLDQPPEPSTMSTA
jgi:hypothetical protein